MIFKCCLERTLIYGLRAKRILHNDIEVVFLSSKDSIKFYIPLAYSITDKNYERKRFLIKGAIEISRS